MLDYFYKLICCRNKFFLIFISIFFLKSYSSADSKLQQKYTKDLHNWINNPENSIIVNIHNFIKPYIFPFLCLLFIVKELKNIGIVTASLGILKLSYSVFVFLKHKYWQFNNSNHYLSTFDNYENEFFVYIILSSIIYVTTLKYFLNNDN